MRTKISVNAAVSMVSKKETPAIRALKRGDASTIRFIIPFRSYSFLPWPRSSVSRQTETMLATAKLGSLVISARFRRRAVLARVSGLRRDQTESLIERPKQRTLWRSGWMVGNWEVEITSGLPVTQAILVRSWLRRLPSFAVEYDRQHHGRDRPDLRSFFRNL